ncbi:helix-turn-helix transcriptional regulator [Streptomyces sp. NPDC056112]|uniref:helix-turn-helix transcriptional regulator n=1 Tax=unclassified Streptomyces TaxID=2593676 RepID=UPI0024819720|nr:helix-turn-helix domain-containing protein [Streptomyces sp. HYC2]
MTQVAGGCEAPLQFELPGVETVYQWRRKRTGPRGFRVGRHLRFDPTDVRTWVDSRLRESA